MKMLINVIRINKWAREEVPFLALVDNINSDTYTQFNQIFVLFSWCFFFTFYNNLKVI